MCMIVKMQLTFSIVQNGIKQLNREMWPNANLNAAIMTRNNQYWNKAIN